MGIAGSYLAFKHLNRKRADDEIKANGITRKRSHLRTSKDSASENSIEFVAGTGKLGAGGKLLKAAKWVTLPLWGLPYLMYKNEPLQHCVGSCAMIACMFASWGGGMFLMLGITLF